MYCAPTFHRHLLRTVGTKYALLEKEVKRNVKSAMFAKTLRAVPKRNVRSFAINHKLGHVEMPETAMITNNVRPALPVFFLIRGIIVKSESDEISMCLFYRERINL